MFHSILFPARYHGELNTEAPPHFTDLNLDTFLLPLLAVKEEYELGGFFYTPPGDLPSIKYRQEILRELEDESVRAFFDGMSEKIFRIKSELDQAGEALSVYPAAVIDKKPGVGYLPRARYLRGMIEYFDSLLDFAGTLSGMTLTSAGLRGFAEYLAGYVSSPGFTETLAQAVSLRERLRSIHYNTLLSENNSGRRSKLIKARKYNGEEPFDNDGFLSLFQKFMQSESDAYKASPKLNGSFDIGLVDKFHADILVELVRFCAANLIPLSKGGELKHAFVDDVVLRFCREAQFYIGWHEHLAEVYASELSMCYPEFDVGDISLRGFFDVALAWKASGKGIVTNDLDMTMPERVVIIAGPNQGGKTTLSRAFGQTHYLASLGLKVPGTIAKLLLCDNVLTHFGKREDIRMQSGQLQDDLLRLKAMFDKATPRSVIIINEIFASTTLEDALLIGKRMLNKLVRLGAPAMVITFLDELAEHGESVISMVGSVRENNPEERTYKFTRRKPDSLVYAMHIAKLHGITPEKLEERLGKWTN